MKMRVEMIFSVLVCFVNGNVFGSSTQNSLNIDIKETEIADIRLDVNVMKGNYHDLLKRVIVNENAIELLKKDKQYLTNEVENLKRHLSCEIEVLHDITGEHQRELNLTKIDFNHTWFSYNKTVHELSYNFGVLDNKFWFLEWQKCEDCVNKTGVVSVCTFESEVEKNCLFYNDKSGEDKYDWTRNSGDTRSPDTGPSKAVAGIYYLYMEVSFMLRYNVDNALLVSNFLNPDAMLCLSFYYHMYGIEMGTLEVLVSYSGTNQTIFTRSGDQGNQWYYKKLYIQPSSNLQIIFNGISGDEFRGDIALDNIILFTGECGTEINEASTQTTPP